MPCLAERRADAADHARHVAVAEQGELPSSWRLKRWPQASSRCGRLRRPSVVPTTRSRRSPATTVTRTRSVKSRALRSLGLDDLDPALLGDRRRVDLVDLLLGVAAEHAEQHGDAERAGVALGDAAEELDLDAVDRRALGEADREAAELAAQRQERAEHLEVLGGDRRHVDRGGHRAAGERGDDLLGGLEAGAVRGLGGRGAQVRRDDHVGIAEQRVLGGRLGAEDVERGARRPCRSRARPSGPRRRSAGRARR